MDNKNLESYPANSKTKKVVEEVPEKKVEKIITGKVKTQQKGLGKKLGEIFFEDDQKSVGSYILYDVLIPAAKDLITDMVSGGIEMLLYGDRRPRKSPGSFYSGRHDTYSNYNSRYTYSSSAPVRENRERTISRTGRARHDFKEIILETRGEAEDVLSHLMDMTADYGMASVADLYDLVGISSEFTDDKYGWVDLRDSSVSRARGGGYIINLPRAIPLD